MGHVPIRERGPRVTSPTNPQPPRLSLRLGQGDGDERGAGIARIPAPLSLLGGGEGEGDEGDDAGVTLHGLGLG